MEVGPPVGEESVQVVPVLLRERPVHCGGDGDDLVGLVDLRPHQFCLQQVDEELLHFGSVDLHKKSLDVSLYGDYEGCVTHPPFLVLLLPTGQRLQGIPCGCAPPFVDIKLRVAC